MEEEQFAKLQGREEGGKEPERAGGLQSPFV
jgi:hypothetical protein